MSENYPLAEPDPIIPLTAEKRASMTFEQRVQYALSFIDVIVAESPTHNAAALADELSLRTNVGFPDAVKAVMEAGY